jgi:hypothetical protein
MAIDQQWISDISTNDTSIIYIHIIDIIYYVNAFPLRWIGWLHYPDVLFRIMLLKLLVMSIKITKFIRKNVSVWYEIKVLFPKLLLHSNHIDAKSIFPSNFITIREMVNLLEFIQSFIQILFAVWCSP